MKVSIVNFTTTTYSYTGSVQQVNLPAGTYKLEVWGAEGGTSDSQGTNRNSGGKGGYSVGTITLKNNAIVYVYVGGQGTESAIGGFNGGGGISSATSYRSTGGGGSDIRISTDSLYSRVIVAGGGAAGNSYQNTTGIVGGYGGGVNGQNCNYYTTTENWYGLGGTQTSGGSYSSNGGAGRGTVTSGSFGIGGWGDGNNQSGYPASGGGGGWYGGGGGSAAGGGGGSGYVYTSSTASNYPSGCLLNSSYYLTNAETKAGNTSFPSPTSSGNETGHSGNGAAKITPVN